MVDVDDDDCCAELLLTTAVATTTMMMIVAHYVGLFVSCEFNLSQNTHTALYIYTIHTYVFCPKTRGRPQNKVGRENGGVAEGELLRSCIFFS